MDRIKTFWRSQVKAEYASAAISAEFAQWLLRVGASPDLVKQCLDIAKDEVDHSVLCHQVLLAAGDNDAVKFSDGTLRMMANHADLRKNVLDALLSFYCLGETVAVPLFSAMMQDTRHETALQAYQRIIQDEPRHSGFGWLGLAWAHSAWPETEEWLVELFPVALQRIARQYYRDTEFNPPLSEREREWGMLPKQQYAEVFEHAVLRLYAKNLRYYGVDVEGVWASVRLALLQMAG